MIARYSSRRVLFGVVACLFVGATLLHGPQLYTFGSSALSTGRPPAAAPSSVQFVGEEEEEEGKKKEEPTDLIEDIRNTTLGFQKIFIIGLPSRSDRRDGMALQAALSNMDVEFVDAVAGKEVDGKAIPKTSEHDRLRDGEIGCWRSHMNAIREIVHRNLTSALILEDDTDWDVRLRSQLHDFALSTRVLTQPLLGQDGLYADTTYLDPAAVPKRGPDLDFSSLPATVPPSISPYGDNWDMLWVGHCGMQFPFDDNKQIAKGRVIHHDDVTMPKRDYLWTLNNPFTLKEQYPEHTRAVHHAMEGVCTLGYAVSNKGARRLLQEVALKDINEPIDILLRFFCEGTQGRRKHTCLTIQPALFQHHRTAGPVSAESDIGNHGEGFNEKSKTDMIRWSVRLNVDNILDGNDMWDQLPDN
ncbi:hypothetical protein S7711_11173 [Stachybotrys chartarum IBT 7711]|uniref:Glycosyl transferase family 25 domain-containing protein n=1 Tax=Stachybotrys chartarum (strain CBS 109288 / IBT 7711) TaxID=1280523 RepID=A0A084AN91_STACB|nr:hypothetical protein S7711_11173 [Stachybotrys chartarum IBT 7711]KFA74345.1 hypothetical protein S40288_10838 [Stachybotrys chartarum IBT 40288]